MERNKGFIKGVLNNPLQLLDNSDWSNKIKVTTVVSGNPKIILNTKMTFACILILTTKCSIVGSALLWDFDLIIPVFIN